MIPQKQEVKLSLDNKDAAYYAEIYCMFFDIEEIQEVSEDAELVKEGKLEFKLQVEHQNRTDYFNVTVGKVDCFRWLNPDYLTAKRYINHLPAAQKYAVVAWQFLLNRKPCGSSKVLKNGRDIAKYLNVPFNSFNNNRLVGLDSIAGQIEGKLVEQKEMQIA